MVVGSIMLSFRTVAPYRLVRESTRCRNPASNSSGYFFKKETISESCFIISQVTSVSTLLKFCLKICYECQEECRFTKPSKISICDDSTAICGTTAHPDAVWRWSNCSSRE